MDNLVLVIPAKAGIQLFGTKSWVPACAGTTGFSQWLSLYGSSARKRARCTAVDSWR